MGLVADLAPKIIAARSVQDALDCITNYYPDVDPLTIVTVVTTYTEAFINTSALPNDTPWAMTDVGCNALMLGYLKHMFGPAVRLDICCNAIMDDVAINPKLLDR